MTQILRQSTAVDVLIGPFVDLTDGATAEEGESPTVLLSKNGQALGAKSDITVPVHDDAGYYNCEFDTTDTNTVGTLILIVEKSATALPVRHEFQVLEEAVYDALFAASAAGYATAAAVWDLDATTHQTQGTFGQAIGDPAADANTIFKAVVSDAAGATVGEDVVAVKAETVNILTDTAEIGAAGAGLTAADDVVIAAIAALPLPAALVGGRIDASVGAMANEVVTAAAIKADAATEIADALLTRQMTEAYAAIGVQPTVAQALFQILQGLTEFAITGAVISVKGVDGVTEKMTFTLDSATDPTSRLRAS
jgi:hypothetical protein